MTPIQVRDGIADWIENNVSDRELSVAEVVALIMSIEINEKVSPVAQEPIGVVAVATVKRDDEGEPQIHWLLEGGIYEATPDTGEMTLVMPYAGITGDDGHGEVYRANR